MEVADARNNAPKRKRDYSAAADDGDDDSLFAQPPPPTARYENGVDLALLEAVEKSQNAVEVLDLKTLKKLVLSFERRLKDNIEARLKYPDQPEKFADSEIELHEEVQKLKILAGGPELYPELVNLNTIPSILGLLTHDNTDIGIDVVGLLQDLTDEDVLEDNDEPAQILVDALIENNVLELLVQNLLRLSETDPDEMAAVFSTLATIENLIEVKPAVAEMVCEKTKLMRWLLSKIKVRDFDGNKQYASEILAILLQNSTANQKRLGQINGVDVVLQAVAMYKSRDPKTPDEEEMVENLFDCLCCLLMPLENKERFVRAEGVELMIIIMNQKKSCYGSAIRALDFAMTNYPPACERFVDVMGLKTAFPAFMGKASSGSLTFSLNWGSLGNVFLGKRRKSFPLTKKLAKCSWINSTDHEIGRTCERLLCLREKLKCSFSFKTIFNLQQVSSNKGELPAGSVCLGLRLSFSNQMTTAGPYIPRHNWISHSTLFEGFFNPSLVLHVDVQQSILSISLPD
ncbi:hypothetical protein U1Q18_039861 [Sarracenia purpurea var. burkii]